MRTANTPTMGMKRPAESVHAGFHLDTRILARAAATILGVVFLLIGVAGFESPGLMGAHLSLTHNLIHLVSGAASLYFGVYGTASGASLFCIAFGLVYGLLGAAGFAFGGMEQHTIADIAHGVDTRLLQVIPGKLELGSHDHLIHCAVGFLYLAAGILSRSGSPEAAGKRGGTDTMRPGMTPPPPPPPF